MNAFAVTSFLNRFLYYPVVLIFVLNLLQRKHVREGTSKRFATLYIGIGLLALWGYTFLAWGRHPTYVMAGLTSTFRRLQTDADLGER